MRSRNGREAEKSGSEDFEDQIVCKGAIIKLKLPASNDLIKKIVHESKSSKIAVT